MRYAAKVHYLAASRGSHVEQLLPAGWEPVGGEIEEGNAMRLLLVRQLSEEEEAAAAAAEATVAESREKVKLLKRKAAREKA